MIWCSSPSPPPPFFPFFRETISTKLLIVRRQAFPRPFFPVTVNFLSESSPSLPFFLPLPLAAPPEVASSVFFPLPLPSFFPPSF